MVLFMGVAWTFSECEKNTIHFANAYISKLRYEASASVGFRLLGFCLLDFACLSSKILLIRATLDFGQCHRSARWF